VEKKPSKFGVHQGYVGESKEVFIKYHMDLQNQLLKIAEEYNWLIIPQVDGIKCRITNESTGLKIEMQRKEVRKNRL